MKKSAAGFKRTRFACYMSYFTNSSTFCVPPLLFVTFHEMYDISYTLLGTLVLANFCTQLTVDLIFSFFGKKWNVGRILVAMPLISTLGFVIYAGLPLLMPQNAFIGLLIGTFIFSVAAGLCEVLLSPTVAAIPSDNPGRDMSLLHSLFGIGVFSVVIFSALFLRIFGTQNWNVLMFILAALPILSAVLFMISPIPDMSGESESEVKTEGSRKRTVGLFLCILCIFFGSCAENSMSIWLSSFMESALGIDKAIGDILGVAGFALLLGLVRIVYARYGKSIQPMLLFGMIAATACYLIAGLAPGAIIPFIACIMTGLVTSMLWPGTLILMEEKIPSAGVAAFAIMAASGDFGAAAAPQLIGIVVDVTAASDLAARLSEALALTPEQIGMRAAMLVTALFPFIGIFIVLAIMRFFKKEKNTENT